MSHRAGAASTPGKAAERERVPSAALGGPVCPLEAVMRLSVSVLVLSSIALAACGQPGKPDPTKPIPWIQKPKDQKALVMEDALSAPSPPAAAGDVGALSAKHPPSGAGACRIPRGYEKVDLAGVLASPGAYEGEKIQVAGWLGARWSFISPAVEGVPVCESHSSYFLGESEQEGPLDEPDARLDIRGPEIVKVGTWCASADVPDAEIVAAWGRVSAGGDELLIDGICAADQLRCTAARHCPGAMKCGAATGVCELP